MKKFDPLSPPRFWGNPPEKTLYINGPLYEGISEDDIFELSGRKYKAEIYSDSSEYRYINITELVPKYNSEYNKQYQKYSKKKRAFEEELVEWQEQKAIWDKEQVAKQERQEKTLYRKLKAKFKDNK